MNSTPNILSAAVSDRGLSDKRPQNEDSFLEIAERGIFAVADGVGGAQAGEVASQMAMEIVGEAFTNLAPDEDAEVVMRTAIKRANAAIYQMAQELPQLANMASTIVALHLAGDVATIAHVGDSRLYSVNTKGELARQTDDHSMVAEEVRAGRMSEEQAENHPSKNIISRALGAEPNVDVDIKTVMVDQGSSFLLCSDGITRHISDREIQGALASNSDPASVCEYLKGLCYERGAEDNLTAVVVRMKSDQQTVPATPVPDEDEPTKATPRSPFDAKALEDDLLDLGFSRQPVAEEKDDIEVAAPAGIEQELIEEAQPIEDAAFSGDRQTLSMFGSDEEAGVGAPKSKSSIPAILGSLVLGLILGFAVYHFAIAERRPEQPVTPSLTEMKSANIPFSSFEENRRAVDKDPAGYLQRFPTPSDADSEDYYLAGRAYILTGDYVKARAAFDAAREHLQEGDAANATVIKNDIAILSAITNDPAAQAILRKELDSFSTLPSNSVNSNSVR
jgi:serine/threonine protein phosphatase PrpC